jgi:hypothetical protein
VPSGAHEQSRLFEIAPHHCVATPNADGGEESKSDAGNDEGSEQIASSRENFLLTSRPSRGYQPDLSETGISQRKPG